MPKDPPTKPETPKPVTKKPKRSPTDVQRDRLTERLEKLRAEMFETTTGAVLAIRENAARELEDRIQRTSWRIERRYSVRLLPLQKMLDALKDGAE